MDETRIKQELDIGAMVLQSKTIPYLSPPQTFVSSHAGPVSHSGSRTGQDLRPASPEIFSQSSSLIEDSVVSSGASLVLNVIGADNVLRVPRSHARGSDSEDTQEGGQCKHCVKSPTVCKCGTCGLRTEAYTQMGGKHCKYNTMEVCINNPTSNSYRKKPYECKHCEYSTSRLDNLKMHTRTHTGEKPYRCEQCEYSASQLGQLTRHMRTHLGDSPYKCEECDYSTFLLANLKTHVRTHTREDPYNCKRCGYTTFELDNFRTHVYTHVEEKIYKCEQCEYSTSRLHNLKMHRRIHTGVKPYRCERCDYSASQQGNFEQSIHDSHPIPPSIRYSIPKQEVNNNTVVTPLEGSVQNGPDRFTTARRPREVSRSPTSPGLQPTSAILSSVTSPSLIPAPKKSKTQAERQDYRLRQKQKILSNPDGKMKTQAQRQREYRLRQKQKILNNPEQKKKTSQKKIEYQRQYRLKKKLKKAQKINGNKPAKKTRADYQREYRLRKKLRTQLNFTSVVIIPRQEAGPSWYLPPVTTAPLTSSCPDTESIITQHERVIDTGELPTAKPKKVSKAQLENVIEVGKSKKMHRYPTEHHNINEICPFMSQTIPTPNLPDNTMQQILNHHMENIKFDKLMQHRDCCDDGDGKHLEPNIDVEHIKNQDSTYEELPLEYDFNHANISYCSHQSVHKLFYETFAKNSFARNVCDVCAPPRCPDLKNGKPNEKNLLRQITKNRFVIKEEGKIEDIMIKQELYIGPSELQPKTVPCPLPSQTLASSPATYPSTNSSDSTALASPYSVLGQPARSSRNEVEEVNSGKSFEVPCGTSFLLEVKSTDKFYQSEQSHCHLDSQGISTATQDVPQTDCDCGTDTTVVAANAEVGRKQDECGQCKYRATKKLNSKKDTRIKPTNCSNKLHKTENFNYSKLQLSNLDGSTHTVDIPYKCKHCDYNSFSTSNLKRHMRTHMGEERHKCEHCQYNTSDINDLKSHMHIHANVKFYNCEQCDYNTFRQGALKLHMRIHTGEKPYRCGHCEYSASQLGHLKGHMRTHTGEKPYKCDWCEYSASRLGSLKIHRRTHTGDKPYKCGQCEYSASKQDHLKRHIRIHTAEKINVSSRRITLHLDQVP
ncbi:Zinc finger protein 233 [Eumeta japonica]|uniref:Zinc finger protein 233 n=1 Tax=Eumeta variegata TaxID=151549 RepID=A0A4C1ZQA6_EUMVA|nr:Zinc finger protein 233 [Eumeta japonica]